MQYATIQDLMILWRPLRNEEVERATKLIEIVVDSLRQEALKVGKDLDEMVIQGKILPNALKSVIVDIVARTLLTSTENEPMIQSSQSALGYTVSGTYLVPGGGIFIKKTELARLGLRKQKIGGISLC